MSTPSPRRRLNVQQRRAAILEAACEVYSAHPYAEVPTAQVAEAAGASPSLVFHYFGSKAGVYAAVVSRAMAQLESEQDTADAALPEGVPVRDRVRTALVTYLGHIERRAAFWTVPLRGGEEPVEAQQVRTDARARTVDRLGSLLGVGDVVRHHYAIEGFLGFVDGACARWVGRGCPAHERDPMLEAALGALEGALGDWRV